MIYQIFYDQRSAAGISADHELITPCGVYKARQFDRSPGVICDDEKEPNLTDHNTLCEWRVLFYVWKHYPSKWVGFTSWQHNRKGFQPITDKMDAHWLSSSLRNSNITGFITRSLQETSIHGIDNINKLTLKTQFLQWSRIEQIINKKVNDVRKTPMGKYHSEPYWDFVMREFHKIHGLNLEKELNWIELGKVRKLHTWCNAFVAKWEYFDEYMTLFSPLVLEMLDFFGSHPVDLELSYICERLIIIFNYLKYSNNEFI